MALRPSIPQRACASLLALLALVACAPSASDLTPAMKDAWAEESASLLGKANFLEHHAAGFESFGSPSIPGVGGGPAGAPAADSFSAIAANDRSEAAQDRALAAAKFDRVVSAACTPAKPKPGFNCDVRFAVKDSQGHEATLSDSDRFDRVDGAWRVISASQ